MIKVVVYPQLIATIVEHEKASMIVTVREELNKWGLGLKDEKGVYVSFDYVDTTNEIKTLMSSHTLTLAELKSLVDCIRQVIPKDMLAWAIDLDGGQKTGDGD